MGRWHIRMAAAALATVGLISAVPAAAAGTVQHYTGQLADGSTWIADVPGSWNGTMILFSHGFGPLTAQDAPDSTTQTDLLNAGYALVGSSYSGSSWWALASAVPDQFGALHAIERTTGSPKRTIAWGMSMGGLVSALEAEAPGGELAGALTTCGLVAGALNLNNYQLDGEYALARLLAPGTRIPLVRFTSQVEAAASATALTAATTAAQNTAAGRARIALAAALMNEPTWFSGSTAPAPTDYAGQEAQQEQELASFVLGFVVTGRYQIELAAGGNSSYTEGVDYAALLAGSSQAEQVRALYREAGIDLNADLNNLTENANITPDQQAIATLGHTSMVTGRLTTPELDIHTIDDQLVPVGQENWYAGRVRAAGDGDLLRQSFVDTTGHCAFQPGETIAALHALESRIGAGHWGEATEPAQLNAEAAKLGATGRYLPFCPPKLTR